MKIYSREEIEEYQFKEAENEVKRLKKASLKDILGKENIELFSVFLNIHNEISESKLKSTAKSMLKSGDIKLANVESILKDFREQDGFADPRYKIYDRFESRNKNTIDKLLSSEPIIVCHTSEEEVEDYILLGTKDGKLYDLVFYGDPFGYDIKETSFNNIKSKCEYYYDRWKEAIKSVDESSIIERPNKVMNGNRSLNNVLSSARSDPSSVAVYCNDNTGKYYVTAESVENYMLSSMTTEITEAMRDIAKVNNIDSRDLSFVGYFNEEFLPTNGKTVLTEKSAEDNAMTLKQAQKYYNTLIRTCKSKAKTKESIDECLKVLKECVKDMERELKGAEQHLLHGGRIKYALKAIIPFNSVYRLFKRNDWQAELSELAGLGIVAGTQFVVANNIASALEGATEEDVDGYDGDVDYSEDDSDVSESSYVNEGVKDAAKAVGKAAGKALKPTKFDVALDVAEVVIRLATYKSMLKNTIKKTKDAIAFLEKKKKELSESPEKNKEVNSK